MKEYGGYLPLELSCGKEYYVSNSKYEVMSLNTGRAAFYCALKNSGFKKVYMPYYNCKMCVEPVEALGLKYEYYFLNNDLTPKNITLKKDEILLWINYFGNSSVLAIEEIINKYPNLIIDNCQAFFTPPMPQVYNVYSCRKFFGVSDGAYLIKNKLQPIQLDTYLSYDKANYLLKSIECGTNEAYKESLDNEEALGHKICGMSELSRRILASIDYEEVKKRRKQNVKTLHGLLKDLNEFSVNIESDSLICYPFLFPSDKLREKLISNKIYIPRWWSHVQKLSQQSPLESYFSNYMFPLPIDQRYNTLDMEYIGKYIRGVLS